MTLLPRSASAITPLALATKRPPVAILFAAFIALRDTLSVAAVQRGLIGTSLVAIGAFTPAFLPEGNPLMVAPEIAGPLSAISTPVWTAILLVGVALLLDSWLRLRPGSQDSARVDFRAVVALWSLPLLPVPPLFSNDSYSYAAQGWMVHLGLNPYEYGPAAAPGAFAPQVDIFWKDTPAPYGPLGLQVQHGIVDLFGHVPFLSAVGMRLPAMLALIGLLVCLPSLAKRIGTDPRMALWLAAANPLVIMHTVGGNHNDALMITGMAWSLWAALHGRFVIALGIVALAAAVKQPAIIMIAPIASLWVSARRPEFATPFTTWMNELRFQPRLMAFGFLSAVIAVAGFIGVTALTGLGFGWIDALSVPGEVRTPLAPATLIGGLIEVCVRTAGFEQAAYDVLPTVRTILQGAGFAGLVALWLRFGRTRPVWFVSWALIVVALTGPALHAWYILWGGTLLALTHFSPRVLKVAVWTSAVLVSYSAIDASFRNGVLALGVTATIALIVVVVRHLPTLQHVRRGSIEGLTKVSVSKS